MAQVAGVANSNVNFMTQTLSFEVTNEKKDQILSQVKQKVNTLEPDVVLKNKADGTLIAMSTKTAESESAAAEAVEQDNREDGEKNELRTAIIRLVLGFSFMLAGIFLPLEGWMSFAMFVIAYLIAGYDVVWRAVRNMVRGQVFDENFLMTIATLAAFYVQEYPEAVAVMLFYQVGELFQDVALSKSRRSIADLMDIRPDYANLDTGNGIVKVAPETIRAGDFILVRPGEKVPLDGKIVEGTSAMDTSALTGESVPRSVAPGDSVLSGFINRNGVLKVVVEKPFAESTVKKILDLVENASGRKAPTEQFITKFARYYTPVVVVAALLLAVVPPLVLPGATFDEWIYRAAIFLVISCPCALVVSIPVGFFGGIGASSRKGILVKGSNYLEGLNDLKYVVMDKTGTLTKGVFQVTAAHPQEMSEKELLHLAAHVERYSTHPIAASLRAAYPNESDSCRVEAVEEIAGQGIRAHVNGNVVCVGNSKMMEAVGAEWYDCHRHAAGTVIHVSINGRYAGHVIISDVVKETSKAAIAALKSVGVARTVMLTGDAKEVADAVAKELGIDQVRSELLPADKVQNVEELLMENKGNGNLAFVGDGINDAPVLTRADIGIAMGAMGSDAAIEAADVVLMDDDPMKISQAIRISRKCLAIVNQNTWFSIGIKLVVLLLGAVGIANMWFAIFADVGVMILAVLNAMRALFAGRTA